jgi:hypothetical protein
VLVCVRLDAAAVQVLAPSDTLDSGSVVTPAARITNLGTSPALVPTRCRIGTAYNQLVPTLVQPGETATVAFPVWTASPLGWQSVRCSTELPGDTVTTNNSTSDSVFVIAHYNAQALAILAPTGYLDSGTTLTPVCRIANLSTSSGPVPVRLTIGSSYSQSRTKSIAAGAADTVQFPAWTASPLGILAVRCSTMLPGDEYPLDDTVSTTITVGTFIDAAATAILAPIGTLDSGTTLTPICRITNNSASTRTIPTRLTIGSSYDQSRTKSIAAGAADTVQFPVWTAGPLGPLAVRCSTGLAGDTIPVNDTASALVTVIARIDAALSAILTPQGTLSLSPTTAPDPSPSRSVSSSAALTTRPAPSVSTPASRIP